MKQYFLLFVFFLSSCSNNLGNISSSMSIVECENAKICHVYGSLEMKSDGHAYIGKLTLENGSCVDVSLPNSQSEKLLGKPAKYTVVEGPVLPYPFSEDISGFEVNGRRVGFGQCGSFYIFVLGS